MTTPPKPLDPIERFDQIWSTLFTSHIHLDALISKQPDKLKPLYGRIVPEILRRPIALAEATGVGVLRGEPWNLSEKQLAHWKPARMIFRQLSENLSLLDGCRVGDEADFPEEWLKRFSNSPVMAKALSQSPPLTVRVVRAVDRKQVGEKIHLHPTKFSPVGLSSPDFLRILNTEEHRDGLFEIQDEGSQVMALFTLAPESFGEYLSETPGAPAKREQPLSLPVARAEVVIDACAGAGGKSLALSDFMEGKGRVYAYDIHAGKIASLKKRARRANARNIQGVVVNENEPLSEKFHNSADRLLVDAPCSGWGVVRRSPDIKWKKDSSDPQKLPDLQVSLLHRHAPLVKSGGTLVYGVCTFRREETLDVVERFLREAPSFERIAGGYFGPGPMDGFFMTAFRKKG